MTPEVGTRSPGSPERTGTMKSIEGTTLALKAGLGNEDGEQVAVLLIVDVSDLGNTLGIVTNNPENDVPWTIYQDDGCGGYLQCGASGETLSDVETWLSGHADRFGDPDPVEVRVPSREDAESHQAICRRFEEYCETKGIDVTRQYGDRLSRLMDLAAVTETMDVDWEGLLSTDVSNFFHDVSGIHYHMDRSVGELGDCFVPRFARSTT